jgi:DNA-binding transcriptional LysR family regulator
MDLWQLRIFCKVVEYKSFSKAARAIHLSQPTISTHIQSLEQHFGCRLIDRLAREALPTEAGQTLYGYARRLEALRHEAEAAIAAQQGGVRGRLRIGASTIPGNYILPEAIGAFTRRHSEVSVALEIADSARIIDRVLAGDLELGVVGAPSRDRNALQEPLISDQLRLIVPAAHPWAGLAAVTIAQLSGAPFIVRQLGSGTLAALQAALHKAGASLRQLNIVAEMGTTTAVIQSIKNGVGVSVLSPVAVREELARGSLKALVIEGLVLDRAFYLMRHRQRSASPLGSAFAQHLHATLAARGN